MKQIYLILSGLLFLTLSCSEGENPEQSQQKFFENASLLEENGEVKAGDNLVFFSEVNFDLPNVFDEQYNEKFSFEAPTASGESFVIDSDEISDLKTFYKISCYCPPEIHNRVKSGTIEGEKLSESRWQIDVDIVIERGYEYVENDVLDTIYSDYVFRLSEVFKVAEL